MEGFPQSDSFQYTLGDLMKLPGDAFTFVYDLGDSWKHIVTLVDIHPNMYEDTDGDYAGAHLISGQGACPPRKTWAAYMVIPKCSRRWRIQMKMMTSAKSTSTGWTVSLTQSSSPAMNYRTVWMISSG